MVKRKRQAKKRAKRQVKPAPRGMVEPYWKGVQARKGTPARNER